MPLRREVHGERSWTTPVGASSDEEAPHGGAMDSPEVIELLKELRQPLAQSARPAYGIRSMHPNGYSAPAAPPLPSQLVCRLSNSVVMDGIGASRHKPIMTLPQETGETEGEWNARKASRYYDFCTTSLANFRSLSVYLPCVPSLLCPLFPGILSHALIVWRGVAQFGGGGFQRKHREHTFPVADTPRDPLRVDAGRCGTLSPSTL